MPVFRFGRLLAFCCVLAGCSSIGQTVSPSPTIDSPAQMAPLQSNSMSSQKAAERQRRLASIRHGDPLADPFTYGVSTVLPRLVSVSNSFTSTEPLATSVHYRAIQKFLSHSHEATFGHMAPDAVTYGDDTGGQVGIIIASTNSSGSNTFTQNGNGSVYDALSYDFEDDIQVAPPNDSFGNYLYAPTTHGPNGNCLESTVDYFNNTVSSGTYFMITDWCRNPGQITYYHIPIDSNFVQNYVEVYSNGDGDPEFVEEVYRDSNNTWHQLLYNNLAKAYDDVYDTTGINNINGNEGWNIFETHFSYDTQCPNFGDISASGLRVQTSNDGENGLNWSYVPNYTNEGVSGDCFDSNNFDFYTIEPNISDLGWFVYDPPQCTLDSDNYCAQVLKSTNTASCNAGTGVHGQPLLIYAATINYDIWNSKTLSEAATNTESVTKSPPCVVTAHWSPGDPKTKYGDPNLP